MKIKKPLKMTDRQTSYFSTDNYNLQKFYLFISRELFINLSSIVLSLEIPDYSSHIDSCDNKELFLDERHYYYIDCKLILKAISEPSLRFQNL